MNKNEKEVFELYATISGIQETIMDNYTNNLLSPFSSTSMWQGSNVVNRSGVAVTQYTVTHVNFSFCLSPLRTACRPCKLFKLGKM